MSEKKDKKRKRKSEQDGRESKKVALAAPVPTSAPPAAPGTVKVSFVRENAAELCPVIAATPGLTLPSNIPLKPYQKRNSIAQSQNSDPNKRPDNSYELLLHSSAHPRMDYSGREEDKAGAEGLIKHYIGVFDPNSGDLQVMETHKVIVRSALRSETLEEAAAVTSKPTMSVLRRNLGMEFGTKKAKKALASFTENAITKDTANGNSNPIASAVLENIQASTASMPTRAETQNAVDAAKPVPKPNLSATTPAEVYTAKSLIGEDIIRNIPVADWVGAADKGEPIQTHSRFVSKRLHKPAMDRDIKRLKILRCLLLLIDFRAASRSSGKGGARMLDSREKLIEKLKVGEVLVELVRRKFSAGKDITKWHFDNLTTHIAALALIIDNYDVDMFDLKEDLRLEPNEMAQYFREIGCRITAPTEKERADMKITKAEAARHKLARLRLPLEFPKQRQLKARSAGPRY